MSDSPVIVYRPAEAARVAQCDRTRIDAACYEGALTAQDLTPDSQKRSWRIRAADLDGLDPARLPHPQGGGVMGAEQDPEPVCEACQGGGDIRTRDPENDAPCPLCYPREWER